MYSGWAWARGCVSVTLACEWVRAGCLCRKKKQKQKQKQIAYLVIAIENHNVIFEEVRLRKVTNLCDFEVTPLSVAAMEQTRRRNVLFNTR